MWEVGLAKMFKERDNKNIIGPCIGRILEISPLKIFILDGDVVLDETIHSIYICNYILNTLKKDDEVLLIPAENEQVFFMIDKIQKAGG